MDKHTKPKRRISTSMIIIIALAVIILAEGAFLLLHRSPGGSAGGEASAAAGTDAASADGADADDGSSDAAVTGSTSSDASKPDDSAQSGDSTKSSDKAKSTESGKSGSKASGKSGSGADAPAPVQTPAVTIPEQNKSKPYAAAIGILQNYMSSPSPATLGYLLGGEFTGDQMTRFLPAILTLSGQSFEQMQTQISAALNLPQNASKLVIVSETKLTQDQLSAASAQIKEQLENYQAISESFKEYKSYNTSEWEQLGAQFNISGTEAKSLILGIGDSATAMADRISGANISDGYDVTLQADTGEAIQVKVFCIGGKWVTGAFFDTQI